MRPTRPHAPLLVSLALLAPTACNDDARPGGDSGSETGLTDGDGPASFGEEEEYELRLKLDPNPPLTLEMNKEQARELFGESAREITLVEVDTTELLTNTLDTIKNACGTSWQLNNEDPMHDCSQTEVGQSFGPNWQCSPEYSMVRLLTMTPANADVEGTSIGPMQYLADLLDIGGGFGEVMAEALGIEMTEEFIDTPSIVIALQNDVLASHPNIGGDGTTLPVSMYDALRDFEPMAETLGPVGPHPGLIAPGFTPYSGALTEDFLMSVIADSNLRLLEGVDADVDKEFLSIIVDTTGPTYADALEFNFTDPDKFKISGVAPNPTLDLRFGMKEHDGFIPSCTESIKCWENLPGTPITPDSVWALDPWEVESLVADAGRHRFGDRQFDKCYEVFSSCSAGARVMIGPNDDYPAHPLGWAFFRINQDLIAELLDYFNSGPPEAQYTWDLINEIGQVILHAPPDCVIPEGEADVEFTLRDIDIGISGPEIAEAVRPYLQAQAPEISQLLLGNYKENNGKVDFYYRQEADGEGYIFFVDPVDQAEGKAYDYQNPGFYSCPQLTPDCKASARSLEGAGDTVHEKLRLDPGETTVYFEDDAGQVFRALFIVPEGDPPTPIRVRLAPKL